MFWPLVKLLNTPLTPTCAAIKTTANHLTTIQYQIRNAKESHTQISTHENVTDGLLMIQKHEVQLRHI